MANKTETVPAERWRQAAVNLKKIVPGVSHLIKKGCTGPDSKEYVDAFAADMFLALTALEYVANYASEDCKFVVKED